MSHAQNSMEQFLRKMNREVFMRISRGLFDAEADSRQLQKYLDTALEINSPEAAGNIHLTIFLLQISAGQFQDAIRTMYDAISHFQLSSDPAQRQRAIACGINQGEVYAMLGQHEAALDRYQAVLVQAEQLAYPEDFGDRHLLWCNVGHVLLALQQSEAAAAQFERAIDTPNKENGSHIDTMIDAYYGLSEVAIVRGDYVSARKYAQLAQDIATRQNDPRRLFMANCALAHVAARDGLSDSDQHYADALAILEPTLRSAYHIVAILEEARFLQRHDNRPTAQRFARIAQEHFWDINVSLFDEEINAMLAAP